MPTLEFDFVVQNAHVIRSLWNPILASLFASSSKRISAREWSNAPQKWNSAHPSTREAIEAGIPGSQLLIARLQAEFGGHAQDLQWSTMENFFDLSRGNTSYNDFQAMFDLAWMDVSEQSGFEMNDIGKAFFLLREAGLTERQLFDLRLRADGDMGRYNDIRSLLSRMFADGTKTRSNTIPQMAGQYYGGDWQGDDDAWSCDSWGTWFQDDDGSWYDGTW